MAESLIKILKVRVLMLSLSPFFKISITSEEAKKMYENYCSTFKKPESVEHMELSANLEEFFASHKVHYIIDITMSFFGGVKKLLILLHSLCIKSLSPPFF